MAFYQPKPVIIEAIQFSRENIDKILAFGEGKVKIKIIDNEPWMSIETLEGCMLSPEHSYLIRGVLGEFYPCAEEAFNKKYELCDGALNGEQ